MSLRVPAHKNVFFIWRHFSARMAISLVGVALLLAGLPALGQAYILNEDFSTASGTTPPTGWSNTDTPSGSADRWAFDNPTARQINYPISGKAAIFDSERASGGGGPEAVTLETRFFDASISQSVVLIFDHFFAGGRGGSGSVEAYNGTSWVPVRSYADSTPNPAREVLNISGAVGGVAAAKVRFIWRGDSSRYWMIDNIRIFAPIALDAGIGAITSPTNPVAAGVRPITAQLSNFGAATLTSTTIGWSINGVAQAPVNWAGSLAFSASDNAVALGSYNFVAGQAVTIKVWQYQPNGQADLNHTNDTIQTVLRGAYSAALCGTYTIGGANGNFESFSAAADALNTLGISCAVVFSVRSGVYVDQVRIGNVRGSSALNTITFTSEARDSAAVTLSYPASGYRNSYIIKLDGTRYIRFSKLGIIRLGDTCNIVATNGVHGLTFSNCRLSSLWATSLDTGLSVRNCVIKGVIFAQSSIGVTGANVTLIGNSFTNPGVTPVFTGVGMAGQASLSGSIILSGFRHVTVSDNIISSQGINNVYGIGLWGCGVGYLANNRLSLEANYAYVGGIYALQSDSIDILHNTIYSYYTPQSTAIGVGSCAPVTVRGNSIIGRDGTGIACKGVGAYTGNHAILIDSNTTTNIAYGISVFGIAGDSVFVRYNTITGSTGTGINVAGFYHATRSNIALVANRVTGGTNIGITIGTGLVRVVNNYVQLGGASFATGINCLGNVCTFAHNTIRITGTHPTLARAVDFNSTYGHTVKNNIFSNVGQGYLYYYQYPPYQDSTHGDHNDFYAPGGHLAYISGNLNLVVDTLADLQYYFQGADAHSLIVPPFYFNTTGPEIHQVFFCNVPPVPGVPTDITGATRPPRPTIGAQEYKSCQRDGALTDFVGLSNQTRGVTSVQVRLYNASLTDTLKVAGINWRVNGSSQVGGVFRGALPPLASTVVTLGTYNFTQTSNSIIAWIYLINNNNDCNRVNDTTRITITRLAGGGLCGNYTIGGTNPDYATFSAAAAALQSQGITCPVTFLVRNGTYNEQVRIGSVRGTSKINTITFQSEAGDSSRCHLRNAPIGSSNYPTTLTLDNAAYTTFRKLDISGGVTEGNVVISNGSHHLKFTNAQLGNIWASGLDSGLIVGNSRISGIVYAEVQNGAPTPRGIQILADTFLRGSASKAPISSGAFVDTYASNIAMVGVDGLTVSRCGIYTLNNSIYVLVRNVYTIAPLLVFNCRNVRIDSNNIRTSTTRAPIIFNLFGNYAIKIGHNKLYGKGRVGLKGINAISCFPLAVDNNILNADTLSTGIYVQGSSFGQVSINNISLSGNTIKAQGYGINCSFSNADAALIRGNTITGTANAGINLVNSNQVQTSVPTVVAGNRVYNARRLGIGLYAAGVTAYNNFVSVGGNSANGGIVAGADSLKLYYNTVNISGPATSDGVALSVSKGVGLSLRNNNFANGSGGYAINLYAGSAINMAGSGANNYYAAQRDFAKIGNTQVQALAQYQALVPEQGSLSLNPFFTTNTLPDINQIALKGAALPLSNIPADIDGAARGTQPTIGAKEYTGCGINAGLDGFEQLPFPLATGNYPLRVRLRNQGSDTLRSDTIFWSLDGVLQPKVTWHGNLLSGSDTLISLGQIAISATASPRVVAWSAMPNGLPDCNVHNDTVVLPQVRAALCGVYTIGGAQPNFASFTSAATALSQGGITCPVIFRVRRGTYNEQVRLSEIKGSSAANTILFESESGDSAATTLSYSGTDTVSNYTLGLLGTSYISFSKIGIQRANGLGGVLIATRAKALSFTNCKLPNVCAVDLDSGLIIRQSLIAGIVFAQGAALPARGIVLEGDTFSVTSDYPNYALPGVAMPTKVPSNVYFYNVQNARVAHNAINATLSAANYYPYDQNGVIATDQCRKVEIIANKIFCSDGTSPAYIIADHASRNIVVAHNSISGGSRYNSKGLSLQYSDSATVKGNTVNMSECDAGIALLNPSGGHHAWVDSNSIANARLGMDILAAYKDTLLIRHNTIANSGVKAMSVTAILLDSLYYVEVSGNRIQTEDGAGLYVRANGVLVANNFIQVGGSSTDAGIQLEYSTKNRVVYNAVNVTSSAASARAFDVVYSNSLIAKNNLFANTGAGYAAKLEALPTGAGTDWDYNDYYAATPGPLCKVGIATYNNLQAWQAATLRDPNSLSTNPFYLTPTDLRPQNRYINGAGIPIPSVILDIDGELRNGSAPDAGADEFTVEFGITRLINPTLKCNLGPNDSVTVNVTQFGDIPLQDIKVAYQVNGGPIYIDTIPGSIRNDIAHTFRHREDLATPQVYSFKVWLVGNNDDNVRNDTLRVERYKGPSPTVSFNYTAACAGVPEAFVGTAIVSPGNISRYEWLFGDGDSASTATPSHAFDSAGTYPVTLRAYTNLGCYGAYSQPVNVIATPKAAFIAANACLGTATRFTNQTRLAPTGTIYHWSFGDGTTSADAAPSHTYLAAGTYDILLKAQAATGCADSVLHTVRVFTNPIATTQPAGTVTITQGGQITLTANPAGATYAWSNGQTFREIIATAVGPYTVTVTDTNGCSAQSAPVEVTLAPPIAFDLGRDTTLCYGDSLALHTNGRFASYRWSTNDTTATLTVSAAGSYWLHVTDSLGNTGADTIVVRIPPAPAVLRVPGTDTLYASAQAGSYHWYLNGVALPDTARYLLAPTSGRYSVQAVDTAGCRSAISDGVDIVTANRAQLSAGPDVTLYPNPARDYVTLAGLGGKQATIRIVDNTGRVIHMGIADDKNAINTAGIANGTYHVEIHTDTGLWNRLLVICR